MFPDRVVVINLDSRPDRWQAFTRVVKLSSVLPPVVRFKALTPRDVVMPTWYMVQRFMGDQRYKAHNYWACRASHLAVMAQALQDGVEHLLVFEDDAVIYPNFDRRYTELLQYMPGDWMGYLLGGHLWNKDNPPVRVNSCCSRLREAGALHCYGLNRKGLQRVYDHLSWHQTMQNDAATSALYGPEPHFYCPPHWIVSQRDGPSDNEGRVVAYGTEYKPSAGYNW